MLRTERSVKRWYGLHKWSSLISTAFALLACITGLPLVFHEEIDHWQQPAVKQSYDNTISPLSLDAIIDKAQALRPEKVTQLLYLDKGQPAVISVIVGDRLANPLAQGETLQFDRYSGNLISASDIGGGFMGLMFNLHVDLFAGVTGSLFLGVMAIVLLVALVSGLVLYAPFMRNRAFAVIRLSNNRYARWFDIHNSLGMVVLMWLFVVAVTGVINTWGSPLIQFWQISEMQTLVAKEPPLEIAPDQALTSLDEALINARKYRDGALFFVAFPRTELSSDHHYILFFSGTEPLSSRLLSPVIINAYSGAFLASPDMPWYINTLLLSQPLHFGDYGGLGLKIVWAVLNVLAIVLLWSGLLLWWRKRKRSPEVDHRPSH